MTNATNARVEWTEQAEGNEGLKFHEMDVEGGLAAAVEQAREISKRPGMMLGMVMHADNRVHATFASGEVFKYAN